MTGPVIFAGIVALIVLAVILILAARAGGRAAGKGAADMKRCPKCAEPVWAGATSCPACRHSFASIPRP